MTLTGGSDRPPGSFGTLVVPGADLALLESSLCCRVFPGAGFCACYVCSLTHLQAIWGTFLYPGVALLSLGPGAKPGAPGVASGVAGGQLAWGTLPLLYLRLCPSAPGSLSNGGADSPTSGPVGPRQASPDKRAFEFGTRKLVCLARPARQPVCWERGGHRELCGEAGGLGDGSLRPS